MELMGQESLVNSIKEKIHTKTFPRVSLIIGESGSGKHTLSKMIAEEIGLSLQDITDRINYDFFMQLYGSAIGYVYIVDMNNISQSKQQCLLKFIEEPPNNSYVLLISDNKESIIETIINRSFVVRMNTYTREQLKDMMKCEDSVLDFCTTPGQILLYKNQDINGMKDLSEKIIDKVSLANYSNVLKISSFFNWSKEKNLFDIDVFSFVFLQVCYTRFMESGDKFSFYCYECANTLKKKLSVNAINKRHAFENMLFQLKGWNE